MIEVFVESIRVNMTNYKRVVMLKERNGERYLPIWIGHFEADAIAIPMQKVPVSRPLTHDMLVNTISQLGGRCTAAAIVRLEQETFYAILVADQGGRHVEIDCRPSDAISAAIRTRAPIYVDEAVMDVAAKVYSPEPPSSAASGEVGETVPYWPGAEPAAGPAPKPFDALQAVSAPVLAALRRTHAAAVDRSRPLIGPGDVLQGLLRQPDAAAVRVLTALHVDIEELRSQVRRRLNGDEHPVMLTPAAQVVLQRAQEEAARLNKDVVAAEHLLLALAGEDDGSVQAALKQAGLTQAAIRQQITEMLSQDAEQDGPRS